MHPDVFSKGNGRDDESEGEDLAVYRELCAPGSQVTLQGVIVHATQSETNVLWVTKVHLQRCSSQPQAVARAVDLLISGQLSTEAGARALDLEGHEEAARITNLSGKTAVQWEVAQLSRRLESKGSRMGTVSEAQMEVCWKCVCVGGGGAAVTKPPPALPPLPQILSGTAPLRARYPVEELVMTDGPSEGGAAGWEGRDGSWWQVSCQIGI